MTDRSTWTERKRGYSASKDQLLVRLRRIEGQVRGVERMVDDDRHCIDVITQISAIQAALDKVALGLLDDHARHCIGGDADDAGPEDLTDGVMAAIGRLLRARLGSGCSTTCESRSIMTSSSRPSTAGPDARSPCGSSAKATIWIAVFIAELGVRSDEKRPAIFWPLEPSATHAQGAEISGIYLHPERFESAAVHVGETVLELRQDGVTLNLRKL